MSEIVRTRELRAWRGDFKLMARFYFDIHGVISMQDREGTELSDVAAARREAVEAVVEMARDIFRSKDRGELSVRIRDENGRPLTEVRLVLTIQDEQEDEGYKGRIE
jgi:hypothetical protein